MEIGQKIILKTNNIIKSLIIHIDNKWLVFCVFFDEELISLNKLIFTEKKTYTFILKSIKNFFKSIKSDLNKIRFLKVVYYNNTSTLVPTSLYSDKISKNLLKFNINSKTYDGITDNLLNDELKNLYTHDKKINNYLKEKFKNFDCFHYTSLLVKEFQNYVDTNFTDRIFLNFNNNRLDILYFKNKKIVFFNSFIYENEVDVLYFLTFSVRQLNLSLEDILISTCGNINIESKIYELLYKYVRNIEVLEMNHLKNKKYNFELSDNILLGKFI